MAACALRGIRYIAFPAVVFEAPGSVLPEDGTPEVGTPEVGTPKRGNPEAVLPETVLAPVDAPVPGPPVMMALPPATLALPAQPVSAQPVSAQPGLAQMEAPAPETPVSAFAPSQPDDAPPRLRRLAELSAAATLTRPQDAAPARRFALLNDIAVELRPRRVRARTGRA